MFSFRNRLNKNVEALVDPSGRTIGVDIDHDNTHLGKYFSSWVNFGSVVAGASVEVLIVTPSTKEIHWRPSNPKPTSDKLRITLWEDPTVTAGNEGTALPLINDNRILAADNPATVKLYKTPTYGAEGGQIGESYLPGATGIGGQRNGSELGAGREKVLGIARKYLLRYTNESSGASIINVELFWYEI